MGFPENILRFQIVHLGDLAGGLWEGVTEHVTMAPQGLSRTPKAVVWLEPHPHLPGALGVPCSDLGAPLEAYLTVLQRKRQSLHASKPVGFHIPGLM